MQWLKNLSIKYKLFLVAVVSGCGFILFVGLNYMVANDNSLRLDRVGKIYFPILEITDRNIVSLDKIKETFTSAVISGEEDLLDEASSQAAKIQSELGAIKEIDSKMDESVNSLLSLFDNYYKITRQFTIGMLEGSIEMGTMQAEIERMAQSLKLYSTELKQFRESRYNEFGDELEAAKSASNELVIIGLLVGGVVVSLVSISLLIVSTLISVNLNQIIHSLKELARGEGDLTQRLKTNTRDETGQVVSGFNDFLDKLHVLIRDVVMSTEQLGANAGQLSIVAESTAESVNTQKIETEQLMTAMTQMVATVGEVAKNSGEATVAASTADSETVAGEKILVETIDVINNLEHEIHTASGVISDLRDRSDDIGGVLGVIRGIAEQTNLLALNAAIEAARAGENGRGFAVVADEVRTLAGRTQTSTEEIQNMIEALQKGSASAVDVMEKSSKQAVKSVEYINKVGGSLNGIAKSVSVIHTMSEEISTATEEQSAVANEMNNNIVNISKIAEQTSMSAQITTSASDELNELASDLIKLVGAFKVK
ncbi:hypothetical protein MNBD_GAMMA25-715 [hydrothermal vent metagenome]|uniref:Methyl-accepting chemotaxis sensor/transducer protein n=1 Tax=hydrothermal vent metagenome TaxID=652676 RepID=A0A3B1BA56_9ZZZZ